MKQESLESHVRHLAFGWTVGGIILALTLSASLGATLMFKDTERQVETLATSALNSDRTDLLSGDVRSTELRLKKEFAINENETLLFLDENQRPWVGDLRATHLESCASSSHLCRDWVHGRIIIEKPIFFDEAHKQLWGYLHIEKSPAANWSLVMSVALAVIVGMIFQALGFYFNLVKSIHAVSGTLALWAEKLSTNPKDAANYQVAPFSEIEPIGKAIAGLKNEIDALEHTARQQGALTTLRGVSHDILNPVSRMKRLLGLIEMPGGSSEQNLRSIKANLKRLSGYAEQLKLIYKQQSGEACEPAPLVDVSKELRQLGRELLDDPETVEKRINLTLDIDDNCQARIPLPALGRIVENLCSNSAHASREGATVTIRVRAEGDNIAISVEDEGLGIPTSHHARIFEPDYTTKPNKGTGLGLFVVKQVCARYGGHISVRSVVGVGTAFKIEFPKAEVKSDLQAALS